MKIRANKGFTLIELLVVIAIIGILSGIVLTSLNSARTKAKDARVTASMAQIRTIAETLYTGAEYPASFAMTDVDSGLSALQADITAQGGGTVSLNRATPATSYAAYVTLPSNTTGSPKLWCVDSVGNSKLLTAAPTEGATVCP